MHLIQISEVNKEKYQSFVLTHGSFLQDFAWGNFQKSQGKTVYRFILEDDQTGQIILSIQLIADKY